jgi:CheY-like chemotaxis protein
MSSSIARLRILLVDDDLLTLECFYLYLERQQAEVRTARSVSEALLQMQSWHPNFVVTDLSLPDQDGYQLIRKIRSDELTKSVPVIVMTGYELERVHREFGQDGSVTAISKPIDPEYLVSLLIRMKTQYM